MDEMLVTDHIQPKMPRKSHAVPRPGTLVLILAGTCLAATAASSQVSSVVEALTEKPAKTAPKPPRLTSAERKAREARASFARVRNCDDLKRFADRYRLPTFAQRVAGARVRLCEPRIETASAGTTMPIVPSPAPQRPRTMIDGGAVPTGRNPIEFFIGGRTVRLAGVVGCHPDNDRRRMSELLSRVLVCRPLGADYQCFTKDTNEDVARVAVENGNAQPTGEDYENEYYGWKKMAEEYDKEQRRRTQINLRPIEPKKLMCLGGG